MKDAAYRQAEQMRCPTGIIGRFAGTMMEKANREAVAWTLGLLELKDNDHVLEIGFGTGMGVWEASHQVASGTVDGIDMSLEMLNAATRVNQAGIRAGAVRLIQGDACKLPYPASTFDKIYAINVLYFWDNPKGVFTEIERSLKPAGMVALYAIQTDDLVKLKPAQTDVFHKYSSDELASLLGDAGFVKVRIETKKERMRTGSCIIGAKKE
jgi:ubiquinone/menaquinone biosynthesis C-methylase UbiE